MGAVCCPGPEAALGPACAWPAGLHHSPRQPSPLRPVEAAPLPPPAPHHGPGVHTARALCQVPQVDGQLVEPVVAQVPVGQDAVKEGKAQRALALGLK